MWLRNVFLKLALCVITCSANLYLNTELFFSSLGGHQLVFSKAFTECLYFSTYLVAIIVQNKICVFIGFVMNNSVNKNSMQKSYEVELMYY